MIIFFLVFFPHLKAIFSFKWWGLYHIYKSSTPKRVPIKAKQKLKAFALGGLLPSIPNGLKFECWPRDKKKPNLKKKVPNKTPKKERWKLKKNKRKIQWKLSQSNIFIVVVVIGFHSFVCCCLLQTLHVSELNMFCAFTTWNIFKRTWPTPKRLRESSKTITKCICYMYSHALTPTKLEKRFVLFCFFWVWVSKIPF